MLRRVILATVIALVVWALPVRAATATASVSVNGSPRAGVPFTFTEDYPKDAAKQARNPQFPNNPQTQINCTAWGGNTIVASKRAIAGGFEGVTYPVTIPAADTCNVALYSAAMVQGQFQLTVWASLQFQVQP